MLTKTTGKTTDTKGCEFHYSRLVKREKDYLTLQTAESVTYVCSEFPSISASTLKELKEKMGAL